MKTFFFTFVLSAAVLAVHAQQANPLVIGTVDSLRSTILKEQRKIWVHLPASVHDTAAQKKYPVVYLLDAEWNNTSVVGMIDFLSSVNGNSVCPEMIVVAIPNTNRSRDLTTSPVSAGGWIDSSTSKTSGGGEAFMAFIGKELIPYIDSRYPTTPYRMLIGHSFGGLTAINTLVHHKNIFKSYLAIDPSMWWDKQNLLRETETSLKKDSYVGTSLFLAMAHTQQPGVDTTTLQKDTSDGTIHPRSILRLSHSVMGNPGNGLDAAFKYYDGDSHSSVPLIATYDALHFIFKDYALVLKDNYFEDSTFRLAAFLTDHFEKAGLKYGFTSKNSRTWLPPEDMLNGLGYFVMRKNQFNKAKALFDLNIKDYPDSYRGYDAMGDFYSAKGDKTNARLNYKKSLSLKETPETKEKLIKLGK